MVNVSRMLWRLYLALKANQHIHIIAAPAIQFTFSVSSQAFEQMQGRASASLQYGFRL